MNPCLEIVHDARIALDDAHGEYPYAE
jgi:hypothetical protein